MRRTAAVIGALVGALLLTSCSASQPRPTVTSETPSPSPSTTHKVREAVNIPAIEGFEPIVDIAEESDLELAAVLTDGTTLVTIRHDLAAQTSLVTAYKEGSAKPVWTSSIGGWVECEGGDPILCRTVTYSRGMRTYSTPTILDMERGTLNELYVGNPGTYMPVGVDGGVAYFLTWDGTEDVHVTGFDAQGAPVADRNLQIPAPDSVKEAALQARLTGGYIIVSSKSNMLAYSIATNAYVNAPIDGECIGLNDGLVCQTYDGVLGISLADASGWRVFGDITVVPGARQVDASLDQFAESLRAELGVRGVPASGISQGRSRGGTVTPTPTSSGSSNSGSRTEERVLLVADAKAIDILTVEEDRLLLPGGGSFPLSSYYTIEAADFSHSLKVLTLILRADPTGEHEGTSVISSVLLRADGQVINQIGSEREKQLIEERNDGQRIMTTSFTWVGSVLVFADAQSGAVGMYRAAS